MLVTSIRWDAVADGPQVLHFCVPLAAEGVSIEQTWDTLGLRATGSHTVVLDDVFVPEAAVSLIRAADVWHPIWNVVIGVAMPLIMSAYVGIADAAVATALDGVHGPSRQPPRAADRRDAQRPHRRRSTPWTPCSPRRRTCGSPTPTSTRARRSVARPSPPTPSIDTVRLAIELVGGVGYTEVERARAALPRRARLPVPSAAPCEAARLQRAACPRPAADRLRPLRRRGPSPGAASAGIRSIAGTRLLISRRSRRTLPATPGPRR